MALTISAVIFDLDGTLIDSLEDLADTTNAALAARGFPTHPLDPYRYFVGDGIDNMLRRAAPAGTDEPVIRELVAHAKDEYSRNWANKTRVYDGIPRLLEALAARGVALAVLSNKLHEFTCEFVAHFFPSTRFAAVLGSPPGGKAKPDPALALRIAQLIGTEPDAVAILGDTRTDMETARAAGMIPVGALWGFRPESELVEYGARILLRRPMDMLEHLA